MDTKILGAAFGGLLGALGYVVWFFWFRPISKYKSEKRRAGKALAESSTHFSENEKGALPKDVAAALRASAAGLSSAHFSLPPWYRIVLRRNGEDPESAATHLSTLSNIDRADHARKRLEKAAADLKLG